MSPSWVGVSGVEKVKRSKMVPVEGTEVFVDDRGHVRSSSMVYLHGGPGQSCWDFMAAQGDRLGRSLRLVGIDQRGVLRSGDLPAEERLTVDALIEDVEAVRQHLGIDTWSVLGHSAGGGYALAYAIKYPRSVRAVIFDCPCWDCDLTDRYRLPVVASRLEEMGKVEAAAVCRGIARKPERIDVDDEAWVVMQELEASYSELFFHRPASARAYEDIVAAAGFTEAQWARGLSHQPLLHAMYQPQVHLLDRLTMPSLLLHGQSDLVTPPAVFDSYKTAVPQGVVHTFAASGHFAYFEQPEEYAEVIATFVRQQAT